jgi:hypothetical protein
VPDELCGPLIMARRGPLPWSPVPFAPLSLSYFAFAYINDSMRDPAGQGQGRTRNLMSCPTKGGVAVVGSYSCQVAYTRLVPTWAFRDERLITIVDWKVDWHLPARFQGSSGTFHQELALLMGTKPPGKQLCFTTR